MLLPTPLAEATAENRSFSKQIPGLQLAVDSTSLGTFKECPRKYYYSVIQGWQPRQLSVHLAFGLLVHGARERYDHGRAVGQDHETTLREMVGWLLRKTWNASQKRPLVFDSERKTRLALVRTMVDYLDKWGPADPLETVILANGKPAVEVSFSFPLGFRSRLTDEDFMACGHLDRIVSFAGRHYIADIKTTEQTISTWWFSRFSPDNQFSMYSLAGKIILDGPVAGVIVDGVQILAGSTKMERQIAPRSESQLEEWLQGLHQWLAGMESCAEKESWPMNDKSCGLYGGCPFRGVCAKAPSAREATLQAEFTKRQWDPLQRRGNPEG